MPGSPVGMSVTNPRTGRPPGSLPETALSCPSYLPRSVARYIFRELVVGHTGVVTMRDSGITDTEAIERQQEKNRRKSGLVPAGHKVVSSARGRACRRLYWRWHTVRDLGSCRDTHRARTRGARLGDRGGPRRSGAGTGDPATRAPDARGPGRGTSRPSTADGDRRPGRR